jgi:diguanylate cyclase (GGDEF)-like protein
LIMTEQQRSSWTILIIDDDVTNLKVALEPLRSQGYEVLTARDGLSGLNRAALAQPDLILLDVQMPGIDGFETCLRLKANPATKAIPVIFMTALSSIEDTLRGFAVGGVDYVSKPFQVEELLARVTTHLLLYQLQRDLEAEIHDRKQAEAALQRANHELQRLAVLDELTQIANRRRFDQYLTAQWNNPAPVPLSLLLCDVDYFKRYNDGYGHQVGDRCLQQVAQGISRAVWRGQDLVARYGGEEFAIILPATNSDGAVHIAATIQHEIQRLHLPHEHSAVHKCVTLSIGVATTLPAAHATPAHLIAAADAALYVAKQQGRNRVATAPPV